MAYRRRLDEQPLALVFSSSSLGSPTSSSSVIGFALRNARCRSGVRASRISPSSSSTSSSSLEPNCAGTARAVWPLLTVAGASLHRASTAAGSASTRPARPRRRGSAGASASKPGSDSSGASAAPARPCAAAACGERSCRSSARERRRRWSRPPSSRAARVRRGAPNRAGARARPRAAGRGRPASAPRSRRARRATPGAASTGSAASRPPAHRNPARAQSRWYCAPLRSDHFGPEFMTGDSPPARARPLAPASLSQSPAPGRAAGPAVLVTIERGRQSPDCDLHYTGSNGTRTPKSPRQERAVRVEQTPELVLELDPHGPPRRAGARAAAPLAPRRRSTE